MFLATCSISQPCCRRRGDSIYEEDGSTLVGFSNYLITYLKTFTYYLESSNFTIT